MPDVRGRNGGGRRDRIFSHKRSQREIQCELSNPGGKAPCAGSIRSDLWLSVLCDSVVQVYLRNAQPCIFRLSTHPLIFVSSTLSGTAPWRRTSSCTSRISNFAPSSFVA